MCQTKKHKVFLIFGGFPINQSPKWYPPKGAPVFLLTGRLFLVVGSLLKGGVVKIEGPIFISPNGARKETGWLVFFFKVAPKWWAFLLCPFDANPTR